MANKAIAMQTWHKKATLIISAIIITLVLIWSLIPAFTKWAANHYLAQYDAVLTAEEINPDLFPIGINLSNVSIEQKEQETLHLEHLSVGLDFWPLFLGAFHVNHVAINGFKTQVTQLEDSLTFAGITIPPSEADTANDEEAESGKEATIVPTFFVRNADIKDISVSFSTEKGTDTFAINHLSIAEVSHELSQWRGIFELSASLNDAIANLTGDIQADKEKLDASIDLENILVSSSDFKHFMPNQIGSIKANDLRLEGTTKTTYRFKNTPLLTFESPSINVGSSNLSLQQNDQNIAWNTFDTQLNDVTVSMNTMQSLNVQADSSIDIEGLKVTLGDQQFETDNLALKNELNLSKTGDELTVHNGDTTLSLGSAKWHAGENNAAITKSELQLTDVATQLDLESAQGNIATVLAFTAEGLTGKLPSGEQLEASSLALEFPVNVDLAEQSQTVSLDKLSFDLDNTKVAGTNVSGQLQSIGLALNKAKITQSDQQLNIQSNNTALQMSGAAFDNPDINAALADLDLQLSKTEFTQSNKGLSAKTGTQLASKGLDLDLRNLPNEQPDVSVSYDSISLNSQLAWQQINDQQQFNAQQNQLILNQLGITQNEVLTGLLDQLNLVNESILLSINDQGLEQLEAKKNTLEMTNLTSSVTDKGTLLNLKGISGNAPSISVDSQGTKASIDQIKLDGLVASQPSSEQNLPALSKFDALTIKRVQVQKDGINVDSVLFDKLISGVALSESREVANLVLPNNWQTQAGENEAETPESPAKTGTPNNESTPFYVVVDRIELSPGSQFSFSDKGISPALSRVLDIEQLTINQLNTRDPDASATLQLKAKNGDYATIDSDISIKPMAERLTMQAKATVREVELPPISPYVSNALGYQIQSGQLNMDLDLGANAGQLSGNTHIVLRQFDLGGQKDSSALLKVGAVPLDLAVDALKNSDNNIVLDLPMKGDIDNPNFQWQNFFLLPIRQGLFKASSTYLMQTFVPYANVISLVQFAGEQALRLRVEPLQYALGEQDITAPEQEAFLDQMIKLMKDRKGAELKACGVSVVKDISEDKTYKSLTEDEKAELLELANQRAESLKRYLVDNGIQSSRVFLCSPAIEDDNNAAPHVTFTF
ncbi:DUF748 domain-containing protein [Marinomonas ostreistagni]|uniref:DUF748 domain-containing protein n=1 Tax=Marinomonas ostreistagni TaxID=359209 RepID=A0ABS0Z8P8_9GAMM|nr:DUF748 domain-containing protein [Marinomonas ostreistagni]MBJ7550031.1 DUF748 domain-containing protein [Marinomonas ostreistagni]